MSTIGVDIGGTKVAAASLNRHALGDSAMRSTDLTSGPALIDQLVAIVQDVRDEDLEAVGIGVPSVVEFATGRVVSSVNVPLADVPLRGVLGARLGVPVFVDNDATVAALAEAHDEDLRLVAHNLVMLTIGTGVGAGIVLDGRIFRGTTGAAGEVGHTLVALSADGVPEPVGFPQPGSLEYVAAGPALGRYAADAAADHPESGLAAAVRRAAAPPGVEAVDAAFRSDATALEILERWGEWVGVGVANAINMFDPDEVVIGGGAARAGELLLEPARRVAMNYVHPGLSEHVRIRLAWHGARAGVLGAALLAAQELQGRGIGQTEVAG